MTAVAIPADLRLRAPDIARRFAVIILDLCALIARAFLRDPRLLRHLVPLWTRLNHTTRRFARLMDHLAANRLPRVRAARPGQPGHSGPPPVRVPTARAWLVTELRQEAAAIAAQLQNLLAEPGVAALLAASPQAVRLVRPLRRMLGIPEAPAAAPKPPAPMDPRDPFPWLPWLPARPLDPNRSRLRPRPDLWIRCYHPD